MSTIDISGASAHANTTPGECPRCHRAIQAIPRNTGVSFPAGSQQVAAQVLYQCPACTQLFLASFLRNSYDPSYTYINSEPRSPQKREFDVLHPISPQFVEVFNEALTAEAYGLGEIAGLAYRKSLEFLVKDFCIYRQPEAADEIKKESLGQVIRARLQDKKIQGAAEKAAWLGNDEAHYIRKWANHDIETLKKLLQIAVSGISEELEYASLMDSFASETVSVTKNREELFGICAVGLVTRGMKERRQRLKSKEQTPRGIPSDEVSVLMISASAHPKPSKSR